MSGHVDTDFAEMEKKLKYYVDKGRLASATEVQEQPMIAVKPDESLIQPLKKISSFIKKIQYYIYLYHFGLKIIMD